MYVSHVAIDDAVEQEHGAKDGANMRELIIKCDTPGLKIDQVRHL